MGVRARRAQALARHEVLRSFARRHGWAVTAGDFRPELAMAAPELAEPGFAAEIVVEGDSRGRDAAAAVFLVRPHAEQGRTFARRRPDRTVLLMVLGGSPGEPGDGSGAGSQKNPPANRGRGRDAFGTPGRVPGSVLARTPRSTVLVREFSGVLREGDLEAGLEELQEFLALE